MVHPNVNFGGGAEAVCAYALDALSREHEVTLLSWSAPDRERLDAFYGTRLADAAFRSVAVCERLHAPSTLHRRLLFQHVACSRYARSVALGYDLVVSTHGELAAPRPAVQYLAHPIYSSRVPHEVVTGAHADWPERLLRRGARATARWLVGGSRRAFSRNVTLTCSAFMAEWVRRAWGIEARVVWPPVPLADVPQVPWEQRTPGVVCVGKLREGKHVLEVIQAVTEARRAGADLHLHIVGNGGGPYADAVLDACHRSPHATYHGILSLTDLTALLAGNRYGVHAFPHEHFGISFAQMVRAGCLPFAADGGAPAQFLENAPALRFGTFQALTDGLVAVAGDAGLQAALRGAVSPVRSALDAHDFGAEMVSVVEAALGSRATVGTALRP